MTFSESADLGSVFAVPCRHKILTFADLQAEVHALARAERFRGCISDSYGAVGILPSPVLLADEERASVLRKWPDYFDKQLDDKCELATFYGLEDKKPPLGDDGILTIGWPIDLQARGAAHFDVLLATANQPSLTPDKGYATPKIVAASYVAATSGIKYFRENVLAHIRTFQDREIWSNIANLRPAWQDSVENAPLNAILSGNSELQD